MKNKVRPVIVPKGKYTYAGQIGAVVITVAAIPMLIKGIASIINERHTYDFEDDYNIDIRSK
jgi:hypothetical protein